MYNFALAFVICGIVYFIGEAVSNVTKAWVPSVFVTAIVVLVGYWTILPKTLISDSMLIPFGSTIGIYLLVTHMGTVISVKQLLDLLLSGRTFHTAVPGIIIAATVVIAFPICLIVLIIVGNKVI